ncbi:MAG: hypothetical protein M1818_002262 [Claussenomyces sp. TS43310]|nr:MAG: hypothetical protein M1818_002262 [Claussenomyces sp. TS43310]
MIKTTRENLELRKSDIPWSTIPEAFQDAIRITRGLGCKYIWIDSLCIIQDDEQDWARESGKMAETYSASYLNIAATEYADPMPWRQYGSQKLLKERSRLEGTSIGGESIIEPARIPVTYDGRNMDVLVRQAPFIAHDDILGKDHGLEIGASPTCWVSPLFRRAWVFQERLLAPRTIFFHHEETVWECRSRINCECGEVDGARLDDDELPNDRQTSLREGLVALDEAGSDAQDMFDLWLDIIQGYSLLELSKESDRLAALSGLASRLSHQFQSTYVAGLWKEDLARSLLWSREPWQITTPSEYYTPSWSWISGRHFSYLVTSNIRYDYVQDHNFAVDSRFQALEIDCAPRSARDPFGRVESGTLKLCGALVMVTIHTAVGGSKMRLAPNLLEHDGDENPFRDDYGQAHSCHTATVDEVFCLLVGEASRTSINEDAHSLALVISRQPSGVYQRLGLLALPKRKRWFDDAAVIEVSLT